MRNLVVRLCPPTLASGSSGRRPSLFLAALLALAVSLSVLLAAPWPASGQQSDQEVPAKPTGLTGIVSTEQVSLSWDDPGDSSITGYQVLRRNPAVDAKGVFHTVVDDTGSSGTSYVDTTVAAETRYFYRVLARNAAGLSSRSGLFRADVPSPDPDATRAGATDLGDITSQDTWTFRADSVDGTSDLVDYYSFTLTAPKEVGLGLRRQDADGDLYLEDGDGTVLYRGEGAGSASESITETVSSGTYYVRVEAQESGSNEYRLRYRVSAAAQGQQEPDGEEEPTPTPEPNSAATGLPDITGIVRVEETLTTDSSGISDANGLTNVVFTHQWVRSVDGTDTDISGATSASYTLGDADLDRAIKVRVSFTDDDGYLETLTSNATALVVRPLNQTASGLPAITGTVEEGATLSADTVGISDGNGLTNAGFAYQWIHSADGTDSDITDAISATYALTAADAGNAFRVRISFNDDDGYAESVTSAVTASLLIAPEQGDGTTTATDEDDFPADTTTSGAVLVGASSRGNIECFGDRDWFSMVLEADHIYQIDQKGLSTEHGSLTNPHLRGIYDSEGVQISDPVDTFGGIGRNSRVTYTPTDGGTYYVSASSEIFPRTNGEGTYELSVLDITNGHPDDFSAGTSTTGTIAVDGKARGNVEFANDRDWFSVTLEADNTYLVELKGRRSDAGTLYDPYLGGIYDVQGDRQRYTTDNNSGIFLESRLLFTPTATGQYFVEAGGYGAVNEGRYTLELTLTPEDDHKAHTGTDSTVAVGGTVPGEIDFAGDEDWFQVTLEALQHYRFDQRGSPSGHGRLGDPYFLGLYDSTGTFIRGTKDDQGGNVGDNSHILYDPTEAGTYYVAAGGYSDSQGTYQLQLRNVTEPDDYPADTSTTGAVSVGSATKGKMEVRFDRDWIGVELESGKTYRLDLRRHGSFDGAKLPDPYLYGIHDADGVALSGTADDNGGIGKNSRVLFIPGQDGTYYVEIGDAGEGQGKYQLKVDEHVDDYLAETGTTGTVEVGGMATGEIEFAGDQDWFSVELEAGRSYEIVLMGFDAGGGTLKDPFLRGVYDGSGALIPNTGNNDQDSSSPDSRSTFAPDGDGTYYLAAGANGAGLGTYKLWVADDTGG